MQAYIPEFILAGLAMLLLLAETFYKKNAQIYFRADWRGGNPGDASLLHGRAL